MDKMRRGLTQIMNMFGEAKTLLNREAKAKAKEIHIPGDKGWGYDSFAWDGYPDAKLPPDCPVTPLGVFGDVAYFVDPLGQIITSPAGARKDSQLFDLFKGYSSYVCHHWPGKTKKTEGGETIWMPAYNKIEVRQGWNCLVNAASKRGLFDPSESLRGRGGWTAGANAEYAIWHAGDLIFGMKDGVLVEREPGDLGGKFYAAGPPLLAPWQAPLSIEDSPGHAILKHLSTWRYKRQKLDPVLLLGAIACAFYGGALEQRPVTLLIGDRGQGKSSMQHFFKSLMGSLLIDAANTTAAGIYQRLKHDSLAVWVDEFEGTASNGQKTTPIIELARQAYSGAMALRGGSDHQGTSFQLSSSFFFSSINPPPMEPADYSRMAIIALQRLPVGSEMPEFPIEFADAGRMLLRILLENWKKFKRHLKDWRGIFRKSGLDSRFCDTFGTFLAGAHVLLSDEGMEEAGIPITSCDEALAQWVIDATRHERNLIVDNWRACLEHLLTSQITSWDGGKKPTIGGVLSIYPYEDAKLTREKIELAGLGFLDLNHGRAKKTRQILEQDMEWQALHKDDQYPYLLAIPYEHPALNALFKETKWIGGGWRTALQQAPSRVVKSGGGLTEVAKISGTTKRVIFVDMRGYEAECGSEREEEI